MITPYNPRFSSNSFLTGPQVSQLPSQAPPAFDVGSTNGSAPLFQSSALGLGLPNSSYPLATGSAFDTSTQPQLQELLAMILQLLEQLMQGLAPAKQSNPTKPQNDIANFDKGPSTQTKPSQAPAKQSHASNGGDSSSDPSPSTGDGTSSFTGANQANGKGWNKNVAVMASSSADKETVTYYSGGHATGGYLGKVEEGMDKYNNIADANSYAQKNSNDGAESSGVTANSLVKGKGGNAVIVTGDNYPGEDADQLADKLKKDYGMNVTVIKNASPNQLKAALQKMGQQNGQQCMVAVLAHGAKDGSGKNNGNIALGKGDGDQWLTEDALKSEVNQYLSPSYGNVNVMFNSCYSGNFVS